MTCPSRGPLAQRDSRSATSPGSGEVDRSKETRDFHSRGSMRTRANQPPHRLASRVRVGSGQAAGARRESAPPPVAPRSLLCLSVRYTATRRIEGSTGDSVKLSRMRCRHSRRPATLQWRAAFDDDPLLGKRRQPALTRSSWPTRGPPVWGQHGAVRASQVISRNRQTGVCPGQDRYRPYQSPYHCCRPDPTQCEPPAHEAAVVEGPTIRLQC